jgi:toxin CcdB
MAKFDVYEDGEGEYWLDCQSNLLSALNSRLVVPLRSSDVHDGSDRRLNPRFTLFGREQVMLTHFAAAVPARLLRHPVASLVSAEYEIGRALDVLIGAY